MTSGAAQVDEDTRRGVELLQRAVDLEPHSKTAQATAPRPPRPAPPRPAPPHLPGAAAQDRTP